MSHILAYSILLFILSISFTNCSESTSSEPVKTVIKKENVLKTVFDVEGMTCEGCESAIQGNLSKLTGVVSVKASHTDKTTVVEYDSTQTNEEALAKAIIETGYKIMSDEEKAAPKKAPQVMKCGEGKCGAGKCGNAE